MMALGGIALSGIGLGMHSRLPAFGAELDGFAINTQDKAVTITLFTDQRVPYTTEHQGKQFTIVLPGTQLSQEQVDNGLPVVIDNKNRFIGRAVPTDDGKVKIILPNLPASDYAVSIQQKRAGQASSTPVSEPAERIQPRPAVSQNEPNRFEQVASSFPKPAKRKIAHTAPSRNSSRGNALKLSPAPSRAAEATVSGNGSVWNPYVVKAPTVPTIATSPYSNYRPVNRQAAPAIHQAMNGDDPINTISVAETMQNGSGNASNAGRHPAGNPADPLWYLHALPPANTGASPADTLQGPAAQNLAAAIASPEAKTAQPTEKSSHTSGKAITQSLKDAISAFPRWLLITLAVFLGGIGLFSSIGGLVLLRVLFSQTRQHLMPQAFYPQGLPAQPADANAADTATSKTGKSGYATRPTLTEFAFEDKTSISSLDYLKGSPSNISQAVRNTVLLKFPSHKKHRSSLKHRTPRQGHQAAAYSAKP